MMPSVSRNHFHPDKVQAFVYHELDSSPTRDLYTVTPEQFFQQIASLFHAPGELRGQVAITFDDGHRSHVRLATPILEAFALKAHFFITTDWISHRPGYMDWNEIRDLTKAGHTIGSHSASHRFLPQCNPIELARELTESRKRLEDHIRRPVKTISMPGGRWNEAVLRACAVAGYETVYTSEPGFYRPPVLSSDVITPLVLGRLAVRAKTNLRTITAYAEGDAPAVHVLHAMYHLRAGVRSVIGDTVYQRVWSHLFRGTTNSVQ